MTDTEHFQLLKSITQHLNDFNIDDQKTNDDHFILNETIDSYAKLMCRLILILQRGKEFHLIAPGNGGRITFKNSKKYAKI